MYGQFCSLSCAGSTDCLNGVCDRYTGYCSRCEPSRWGLFCNLSCPNCIDDLCQQDDGVCQIDCQNRFYGPKCNKPCHSRCLKCGRETGECNICDIGTYGDICERDCSPHCQIEESGYITCSREDGFCTSGSCLPGYFDPTCRQKCNRNCALDFDGIAKCDFETGHCLSGCFIGYFGPSCSGVCSETCLTKECRNSADNCTVGCIDTYYGFPTCNLSCSENCIRTTCFDHNGTCTFGCKVGFFGEKCDQKCNLEDSCIDMTCDREFGYCKNCDEPEPSFQCRDSGNDYFGCS